MNDDGSNFWTTLDQAPALAKRALVGVLPESWAPLAGALVTVLFVCLFFISIFALLTLVERKALGRMQNRPGPNRTGPFGLLQPLADAIKMLVKEDIVPHRADRLLHFLAPVILVVSALLAFAVLPFGRDLAPVEFDGAILFFFAAGAGTEFAVFLAGWASHNKYSLLSAMRALAQLIAYELPLLLAVVPVVMLAGTLVPQGVVEAQAGYVFGFVPRWHLFEPWGLAAGAVFLVAALAEANRSPFDLPEAESELVAGHLTEYSGFKYALFFMAEYLGMTAMAGMMVTLFLGGWHAPLPFLEFLPSWFWFLAKMFAVLGLFIWVRGTLPRLRMDQLTRFAWKLLLPLSFVNLLAAGLWHYSAAWDVPAAPLVRWALVFALPAAAFVALARSLGKGLGPRSYRYAC